jgi:GAF domain-containing protein
MNPDKLKDFVDDTVRLAMQMLHIGEPQHKILTFLVEAAQAAARNETVSSILVIDKQGLLRNAASPGLPYDYLTAIDGLKPNPKVGTCAAAAATGKMVITLDFTADDKWAELRHLPMALGFLGAWSMPIKADDGKVLGTFGTYFRESRRPSQGEILTVGALALAAARILTGI